jgi:catechol 2,3-dioxygenase-like lactoylglutathione lyase family enzyme
LDNRYYFVSDIKKAVEFYNGVLGLSVIDQDDYWASISLNGVRLLGPISRTPWGSHVSFADPDGNLLDLRQGP